MKILYIESKLKNLNADISEQEINKLPEKLFLVYSVQYKDLAESIKKQLIDKKIKIMGFQQVLGCSKISNKSNHAILLIGSGRFHLINLLTPSSDVYFLENNRIIKIPNEEIEKLKAKQKSALIKFLNAEKIGILVSTKPGQENLEKAVKLRQKLNKKGKQAHIFISNNINVSQFENFNISSWINTACPGLALDNPNIINYTELPEF